MTACSEVCAPARDEREFVALQLLRASCDHARALTYLLANNPADLAGSALTLHRSQIEQYLRAIWVCEIATSDELEDFLVVDKGPRRKTAKGKWSSILTIDLAAEVNAKVQSFDEVEWEAPRLASTVASAWDPLCGMVHGGKSVRVMYADHLQQIGCAVPWRVCLQTTINAVAITNFCLAQTARMAPMTEEEVHDKLTPPSQAFESYLARRKSHLEGLGIRMRGHILE